MLAYYLLFTIPILLSFLNYDDDRLIANKRFPLLVFFGLFIVLLSLRSVQCGVDLFNYKMKFENADSVSVLSLFDFSMIEPGYDWFSYICKSFIGNFQIFLCVCALISVVPITVLYLKETEHNLLTIALFVGIAPFTMFFSGLRQSIAMGLGAICYMLCKKNRLISFVILVFVAFLFHQSSIIMLLMYPLTHIRITKKWIFPIAVIFALCLIFNKQIFGVLISMNHKYESRYIIADIGSYTFLVMLLILTVFSFVIPEDDEEIFGLRNMLVLSLLLQCFAPINTVAMRLNYYYLIFVPLLIPKIIDNSRERYKQVAFISSYVFFAFFIIWFFKEAYTGSNYLQAFPYIPFWSE